MAQKHVDPGQHFTSLVRSLDNVAETFRRVSLIPSQLKFSQRTKSERQLLTLSGETSGPVPSHGGPAIRVAWSLKLNGVELAHASAQYPWVYNRDQQLALADPDNAPFELKLLESRLIEALAKDPKNEN